MKKTSYFTHLLRCMKKPYKCFHKHLKTYKYSYVMGLFGSFAVVKLILLISGLFGVGVIYYTQHHASANIGGPNYINENQCYGVTQISVPECLALVRLYNNTEGPNWITNTNRGSFPNVCNRYGVICGGGGVTHLYLSINNLAGKITPSIERLSNLIGMHIGYNSITYIDPKIGKLPKLDQLYINNNLLNSLPPEIGNLEQLTRINASYNQLTNKDFSYLFPLKKIEYIYFSNNLVQKIEDGYLSLVPTLRYLDLSYNQLRDFNIIGDTRSDMLNYLYLRHNRIDNIAGNIGDNLIHLKELDVGKNRLGDEPANFLGLLKEITHLRLDHNLISEIPNSFSEFSKNNTLKLLDMSYNTIENIKYIPDIISLEHLSFANNLISEMFPLGNLTKLEHLDLGFNKLKGDLSTLLTELLKIDTSLKSFSLRHNQLEKEIPEDIMSLTALQNGGCQIDYNRFPLLMKPILETRLDTKCFKDSEPAHYENTDRRHQYATITTLIKGTAINTNDIYPGDEIQFTIDVGNMSDYDRTVDQLRLALYKDDALFSVIDPTDGTEHILGATFEDNNDLCFKELIQNTAGPYYDALNTRAVANGHTKIDTYLSNTTYRDRDGYAQSQYDNFYSFPRGDNFSKRMASTTYDAFNFTPFTRESPSFYLALNSRLFAIRSDDLTIEGCGIDGKLATIFSVAPLDAGDTRQIVITLKIDDNAAPGSYSFAGILESTNRLYLESDEKDNAFEFPFEIKKAPISAICGNDIIEGSEQCDGSNLSGESCQSLGFDQGTLSCSASCTFDTSACSYDPVEFPLEEVCTFFDAYMEGLRHDTIVMFNTVLLPNIIGFEYNNFPYLRYFAAISHMNIQGLFSNALAYMNLLLSWQGLPPISSETEFRDAVDYFESMMLSGTIPLVQPLQGTIYNQGLGNICAPTPTEECGNGIIEGNEACDGTDFGGQSCANFGYSQGTLSCTPGCTINTSNCSNPPSGGGGGGGGSPSIITIPDDCPDGDYTLSAYDGKCGTPPTKTIAPSHGSAEVPITRKELAGLLSAFAKQVLNLTLNTNLPCNFTDTNNISSSERISIKEACQYRFMGYNEDGLLQKTLFNPNNYVTRNMLATTISRMLRGNTYNLPLGSKIRYQKHLQAMETLGILSEKDTMITQKIVLNMLSYIQKNPELVDRNGKISHTSAPTTSTPITSPATTITITIKELLEDLRNLMRGTITPSPQTTPSSTEESHSAATDETPVSTVTSTSSERTLREDLSRFFGF